MTRHLVLCREGDVEALERDQGSLRILQVLPPRLALIDADEAAIGPLRHDARIVLDEAIDAEASDLDLTEAERLTLDGWRLSKDKDAGRLGEGLAWDSEGFSAP